MDCACELSDRRCVDLSYVSIAKLLDDGGDVAFDVATRLRISVARRLVLALVTTPAQGIDVVMDGSVVVALMRRGRRLLLSSLGRGDDCLVGKRRVMVAKLAMTGNSDCGWMCMGLSVLKVRVTHLNKDRMGSRTDQR